MTCGDLRGVYQANACCSATAHETVSGLPGDVSEPPIPGMMPGTISLAVDTDYPPYAYVAVPPEGDFDVAGFGHDVAHGLMEVCNITISTRQADWAECWDGSRGLNTYGQGPKTGVGIEQGYFHGCMTYTHTTGIRNRFLEFTDGILQANKPAGLLTRLDANGVPHVLPNSTLEGLTIVDVAGWAPTADGLALVNNYCTNSRYGGYTVVAPPEDGNDAAMAMVMSGEVDAMWVYADQAYNFQPKPDMVPTWNESLWEGFGTKYAYIATGQFGHAYNGTTLAISKKGSGLSQILNPCIQKFMKTRSYYEVCLKHGQEDSCYENEFFNGTSSGPKPWMDSTDKQTGDCSSGYCPCSVVGLY